MTDEIGPWLWTVESETKEWVPPTKWKKRAKDVLKPYLNELAKSFRVAQAGIERATFSIPGRPDRFVYMLEATIIYGTYAKAVSEAEGGVKKGLDAMQANWAHILLTLKEVDPLAEKELSSIVTIEKLFAFRVNLKDPIQLVGVGNPAIK